MVPAIIRIKGVQVLQEAIILIGLLALSAMFSGAEIAMFSVSTLSVKHLMEKGKKGAKTLYKLKSDPNRLLITALVGNNLVNIGAAAYATKLAIGTFGSAGVGIATGIMTLLILVFGEVFPKSYATSKAAKISLKLAGFIYFFSILFFPIVALLNVALKKFVKHQVVPRISEDELKVFVRASKEEGSIKQIEAEMINNIFEFDETTVGEIMTPRLDMFCLDADKSISEVKDKIKSTKHTRIPIYLNKLDNIIGVVHMREIMQMLAEGKTDVKLKEISREPLFVPESKKIYLMLRTFQKKKNHLAVVVDEYGVVIGLVTLEDVLEEVVGEIYDESEEKKVLVKEIKPKHFIVEGKADIYLVNEKIHGLSIEESPEYDSVGGFVLTKLGRIPSEGESFRYNKYNVIVKEVVGNRILKLEIKRGKK